MLWYVFRKILRSNSSVNVFDASLLNLTSHSVVTVKIKTALFDAS